MYDFLLRYVTLGEVLWMKSRLDIALCKYRKNVQNAYFMDTYNILKTFFFRGNTYNIF
jgi:hypothetical protein